MFVGEVDDGAAEVLSEAAKLNFFLQSQALALRPDVGRSAPQVQATA